jgi:thiol-disulfide isomerase/thioredoxin
MRQFLNDEALMKRGWIFCLVLFLVLNSPRAGLSGKTVKIYLFHSEETGGTRIEEEVVRPLSKKYPIEVRSLSINQLKNYDLLTRFEKELKDTDNELPAIIIGDRILGGEAEIRSDLENLVKLYSGKGGTPWPSLQTAKTEEEGWIPSPPTEGDGGKKVIYGAFLYMPGCLHCEEMKADLKKWAAEFPDLKIRIFSLTRDENKRLDEALSGVYRVPESKRLVDHKLYLGEDYLWAEELNSKSFRRLLAKYEGKGAPPPWEKVTRESLDKGEKNIVERFKRWSLSAVLAAGFIDGVNPCAFATMIFLVSYLTFAGKKRREILLYGIVFTSGVFIAYLLVGMGLMTFLHQLSGFPLISRGVYLFIAFFALALGIISIYDYLLYRRGETAKWKLQLPSGLKKKIHEIIREEARVKGGLFATFGAGFIIAVCTVICTGQVYLPTIGYIMGIPELRANAVFNLVLYNLMYILPLIGVFVLAFFGVTSERMAFLTQKYTGAVKLLTAVLFLSLAGLLFLLH